MLILKLYYILKFNSNIIDQFNLQFLLHMIVIRFACMNSLFFKHISNLFINIYDLNFISHENWINSTNYDNNVLK